jgi:hypothetical protein
LREIITRTWSILFDGILTCMFCIHSSVE